jgi:hypothetical protein
MPTEPKTKMKYLIMVFTVLMSLNMEAHQPDVSTVILSEDEHGKLILQMNGALTAFEGEIDYIYSKNAYKTPEEFKNLVIEHFKKNFLLIINEKDTLVLANPMVILGHETKLVVELLGMSNKVASIYLKNTVFKDIPQNQSAVIMLKSGLPKEQYILNAENNQTLHLVRNEGKWTNFKKKESIFSTFPILYILPLTLLSILILLRNKKRS